jgi:hypothetical protein
MKTGPLSLTVILCIFLCNSCATYTIPVDSFRKQFGGMDSAHLKKVTLLGPAGESGGRDYYLANPYPVIHCLDKNRQDHILLNKPSIEIRFTYKPRDRRVVFYFDRIFVTDSTVIGVESRFIPSLRKTLALDSITKIEVQDGHKKFYYANTK